MKKRFLKSVLGIVLGAALVTGLVACGTKKEESSEDGKTKEAELSVMIWDSNQEAGLAEIIDDFTEKTGIKAELQVVSWDEYWTLLSAGAEGDSMPDVFWMHSSESQRYMSNDMLLDVTAQIEESEEIDLANYPEDIVNLYVYDSKNYAVPKDIDTIAIWYNKTLFDEAGLEYPTADWTWDDLLEYSKKLTKDGVYGFYCPSGEDQSGYYNMIYDKGGFVISDDKKTSGFDNEKTIEAMMMMNKFIEEGVMPSQEMMSETSSEVMFQSGKVAMVPQGSFMLAAHKANDYSLENAAVVELPKDAETGRQVSIMNGLGWAASAGTKHPEEAWKLLEYFGSEEAQTKQAELGVTMSAYNGVSDSWVSSNPEFDLQPYVNMQKDMVVWPHSKNTAAWRDQNLDIFKKVWMEEITMEEGLEQVTDNMNEKLSEE